MQKSADAFRTISEVAEDLSLPQHVLRFWETRFPQIRPLKRAGGRRYYRPTDVLLLKNISQLLYDEGYTIKGVQRLLKEQGVKGLSSVAYPEDRQIASDGSTTANPDESGLPLPDTLAENAALSMTADLTSLSNAHRDAIAAALVTVEECKRILDAVRRSAS